MAEPKLQSYIKVLATLLKSGSLSRTEIVKFTNINEEWLKKNLGFLSEQGLVRKEATLSARESYSITDKGIKVLNFFRITIVA